MRQLKPDQIDLWCCYHQTITATELLNQYHECLHPHERFRMHQFHFQRDQHVYLLTRAMLKYVLSLYDSNTQPHQWQFELNQFGKPAICNHPLAKHMFFNLSHSHAMIVLAVGTQPELGADVEAIKTFADMDNLAKSHFATNETAAYLNLAGSKRVNGFYDFWTLKEAYIKARGMGLSIPLNQFEFNIEAANHISIDFIPPLEDDPLKWQFWQYHPHNKHKIALAIKRSDKQSIKHINCIQTIPWHTDEKLNLKLLRATQL